VIITAFHRGVKHKINAFKSVVLLTIKGAREPCVPFLTEKPLEIAAEMTTIDPVVELRVGLRVGLVKMTVAPVIFL
jgi:hypothetical protein